MDELLTNNESLFFSNLVLRAEVQSLLAIVREVCEHTGYTDSEGLSLMDRFYTQRAVELEVDFRRLEDVAPKLAAKLHDQYEQARAFLGNDRS